MAVGATRRERYDHRVTALKRKRAPRERDWRATTSILSPFRTQWELADRNRGERKTDEIYHGKPQQAVNTLSAGLMAGITSPARIWFVPRVKRRGRSDVVAGGENAERNRARRWRALDRHADRVAKRDRSESRGVRMYLDEVREVLQAILADSNFYPALCNGLYPDCITTGTGAMLMERMPDGRIVFEPLLIGQYSLDCDHEGNVDTCAREFQMSTRELVQKFGLSACSQMVRECYERGELEAMHDVVHLIQPNDAYKPGSMLPKHMRWSSCWWLRGETRKDTFLRESGYERFPVAVARWRVRQGDVYGYGPGDDVRADAQMLQHLTKRKIQMVDKLTNPPVIATGGVRKSNLLPGAFNVAQDGKEGTLKPVHDIPPQALGIIREDIESVLEIILTGLHYDLWRRLLDDDRKQRATATEIEAMRQELLLMLGPLLENLQGMLRAVIEFVYMTAAANAMLPPLPDELRGESIDVEFVSIMHQMQQVQGLVGFRTFLGELSQVAALLPQALDNIDVDVIVREVAKITGIPAEVLRTKETVDSIRQMQAQQKQAADQGGAMVAATQGVRNLASADPARLSEFAKMFAPVAAAQAGQLAEAA